MEGVRWPVATKEEFLGCYRATVDDVFAYSARLTGDVGRAEDLVHDVYVALLRRVRGGDVTPVGAGFLCRMARNRFLDGIRSAAREDRRLRLLAAPGAAAPDETPAVSFWLAALPDRERAAFVLRYVDDLSVGDVAAALGSTVRATESLLQRAKRRLREIAN